MTRDPSFNILRLLGVAVLLLITASEAAKLISYTQAWSDPSTVNLNNVDIVNFAFAVPSGNAVVLNDPPTDGPRLQSLVNNAHAKGKKVVLSVGGWTHGGFSDQVKPANQAAFAQSIKSIVTQYNLDGVDIDWEYPNDAGAGHSFSPDDTANLQTFLPALRKLMGTSKIISMAVPQRPWKDANGLPSTDLSKAAASLSFVVIMNYDVAFFNIGPNAPYKNGCNKPYYIGAVEAIALWRQTGFPASKLVLGVPYYGYNYQTSRSTFVRSKAPTPLRRAHADAAAAAARHSLPDADEPALHGRAPTYANMQTLTFAQLIADGDLVRNRTTGKWVGGGGYRRRWDACSSTPYLVNNATGSLIAYDDPDSIYAKGRLAGVYKSLYGGATWSMQGDYQGVLTAALRAGLDGK